MQGVIPVCCSRPLPIGLAGYWRVSTGILAVYKDEIEHHVAVRNQAQNQHDKEPGRVALPRLSSALNAVHLVTKCSFSVPAVPKHTKQAQDVLRAHEYIELY